MPKLSYLASDELVDDAHALWADQRWQVRRVVTQDFSELGTDPIVRSTIDVDVDLAFEATQERAPCSGMLPIPVGWTPKSPVFRLDAQSGGESLHVVRRSTNEKLSLRIIENQIKEEWKLGGQPTKCVMGAVQNLVIADTLVGAADGRKARSLAKRATWQEIASTISRLLVQRREGCYTHHVCQGQWAKLTVIDRLIELITLFHVGYIRLVLLPLDRGSLSIIKISETLSKPVPQRVHPLKRFSRKILQWGDLGNWSTGRQVSVCFSEHVDALKVIAPEGARVQSTYVRPRCLFKGADKLLAKATLRLPRNVPSREEEVNKFRYSFRDEGEWAYAHSPERGLPVPLEGEVYKLNFETVDVATRRSQLIAPALALVTISTVLQFFLFAFVRIWGIDPEDRKTLVGWVAGLAGGLPTVALSYVAVKRESRFPHMGFNDRYRFLLVAVMIAQLVCTVITYTSWDATVSIRISLLIPSLPDYGLHPIAFSFALTLICLMLFLDAALQVNPGFRYWRRWVLFPGSLGYVIQAVVSIVVFACMLGQVRPVVFGVDSPPAGTVWRLIIFPLVLCASGYFGLRVLFFALGRLRAREAERISLPTLFSR